MIGRRAMVATGLGLMVATQAQAQGHAQGDLAQRLAAIEAASGGRLGVAVLDSGSGRLQGHRLDERFPLCSTFKALAAAAVLQRVDAGQERLDRLVRYTAADVVTYSPATGPAVERGLTMGAICEAAVTLSDNTAGNLMLDTMGGPAGLTAFLRGLGDTVTRLDRRETALNEATPGDPRDTTSPRAMAETLRKLLLGEALSAGGRAQLTRWLVENQTGGTRLRAGLAPGWRAGEKTGTGGHGSTNDAGILWPPGERPPLLVAAYLAGSAAPEAQRYAALAEVARAVVATYPAG